MALPLSLSSDDMSFNNVKREFENEPDGESALRDGTYWSWYAFLVGYGKDKIACSPLHVVLYAYASQIIKTFDIYRARTIHCSHHSVECGKKGKSQN